MTIEQNAFLSLSKESQPIHFPNGLIGLEEWQQFVIISHPIGEPLQLLQSTEDERISFIVANPDMVIPDYHISLSAADVIALQLPLEPQSITLNAHQCADLSINRYCILSIQEVPLYVTVNLLGPLLINVQPNIGRQVILSESIYDPRYPLTDLALPAIDAEEAGI